MRCDILFLIIFFLVVGVAVRSSEAILSEGVFMPFSLENYTEEIERLFVSAEVEDLWWMKFSKECFCNYGSVAFCEECTYYYIWLLVLHVWLLMLSPVAGCGAFIGLFYLLMAQLQGSVRINLVGVGLESQKFQDLTMANG